MIKNIRIIYIDPNEGAIECNRVIELFGLDDSTFNGCDLIGIEDCVDILNKNGWSMVKCDMPHDDLIVTVFEKPND